MEPHVHQIGQGAAELLAVIPAGADNDLSVHLDTGLAESTHVRQGTGGVFVAQHGAVQLGVGGVDGDIDGGDMQVNNTLRLPLGQIGQGDVVAQKKAQTGVIVLEIERLAHVGRHLIHKAEDAVVGAGAHLVHQIGVKVQSQIPALRLANPYLTHAAVRLLQRQIGNSIISIKAVIQYIGDLVTVDGQQLFADADVSALGRGVPVNTGNHSAHFVVPR